MKKTPTQNNPSRRRFLQGTGATVALPFLELYATPAQACGAVDPRFIVIYYANGCTQDDFFSFQPGNGDKYHLRYTDWKKNGKGKAPVIKRGNDWNPARIIQPYVDAGLKNKIAIYNHLDNNSLASSNTNMTHATACCAFLTCQGAKDRKNPIQMGGRSFDHVLAEHYAGRTSLRSMHLSSGIKHGSGNGSDQTYSNTLTWDKNGKPIKPYVSPRDAFKKYFGNATQIDIPNQGGMTESRQKSVLDFVLEDADRLKKQLGQGDQDRLDEYLTAVREMEMAINAGNENVPSLQCDIPAANYPHYSSVSQSEGLPKGYDRPAHMQMNFDMMYLALKCGLTNVVTYLVEEERAYFVWPKSISNSTGHYHGISHSSPVTMTRILQHLNRETGKFVKRLDNIKESNGMSMLDNSVTMIGSGMNGPLRSLKSGERNKAPDPEDDHQRRALPIIFAGSGGGKLRTNQEVCFAPGKRFANVYQTLATHVYCTPEKKFAHSNGEIKEMLL